MAYDKCDKCGKEVDMFHQIIHKTPQGNKITICEECNQTINEEEKKENQKKIEQKEAEKQIQKESLEIIQKKNKLRSQKYIGVIFAVLGVLFFLSGLLYAFNVPGFFGVSPLIILLFLGIGFWLSYKAEKDLKKLEQ